LQKKKIRRAFTEREILATADHPFIVTLYYCFQSEKKIVFIMEFCAGGEFYRVIHGAQEKCLQENVVKFYAAEVLLALEYLHMKGFIYRDLKPENVLLHESGHIRLTDFDLSKAAQKLNSKAINDLAAGSYNFVNMPMLLTNSFVGTEEYLAPEIILNEGHGAAVDFWTYGILIYEMTFRVTPFKGKSQDDTFNHILDGEVKFPENHVYNVSSSCKSLIKKLLHQDPKKRLGATHGASEIKKHKFFQNINFNLIRNMTPPIIPKVSGPTDTSNFKAFQMTEEEVDDEIVSTKKSSASIGSKEENPFIQFTPIAKPPRSGI